MSIIKTLFIHTTIEAAINTAFDKLILNFNSIELYAIKRIPTSKNRFHSIIKVWVDVLDAPVGTPVRTMKEAHIYARMLNDDPMSQWPRDLQLKYLHTVGHVFR